MKWFKLDSGFHKDGKVFSSNDKIFRAWIILCSMLSEKYTGDKSKINYLLDLNEFKTFLKVKQKSLETIIKQVSTRFKIEIKLFETQNQIEITYPKFLEKQSSYFRGAVGACNSNKSKDNKSKDNKNKEKDKSKYSFDELWQKYPSKLGRKAAERHFNTSVKNDDDFKNINIALNNYLSSERVSKGFIQNGSTWFNNWSDWVKMGGGFGKNRNVKAGDRPSQEDWDNEPNTL